MSLAIKSTNTCKLVPGLYLYKHSVQRFMVRFIENYHMGTMFSIPMVSCIENCHISLPCCINIMCTIMVRLAENYHSIAMQQPIKAFLFGNAKDHTIFYLNVNFNLAEHFMPFLNEGLTPHHYHKWQCKKEITQ